MSKSTKRNEALEAILAAVPPRASEADRARENLESLDDAALEDLRSRVTIASYLRRGLPKPAANEALRASVRDKLAMGFTQLAEVGKRIDATRREKAIGRTTAPEPASRLRKDSQDAFAPARIDVEARKTRIDRALEQADSSWARPLLLDVHLIAENIGKSIESGWRWNTDLSNASIMSIEESVVAVDPLQSVISKQITEAFQHSTLEAKAAREVTDLVVSSLNEPAMKKYLQVHLFNMVRDIVAMTIDGTAVKPDISSAWRARHLAALEHLKPYHLKAPPPAIETNYLSEQASLLPDTAAIDGFAKMVVRTREFDPDQVLFVAGGGEMAGQLVQRTLAGNAYFGVYDPHAGIVETPRRTKNADLRILVIDDISRSGTTLEAGLGLLRQKFSGASVRVMALVGTVASARRLGDRAFFPTISPDPDVDVPWDRAGKYHATKESHVLGWGKEDPLAISKNMLERAIGRLGS